MAILFLLPITGVEPAYSQFCPGRGTGWTRGISSRWSISFKETQWGGPVTSCPPDGDPGVCDVSWCCGPLEAKRMAMPRSRADAESGGGNKGIRTGRPRHCRPIWGHPVTGLPLCEITRPGGQIPYLLCSLFPKTDSISKTHPFESGPGEWSTHYGCLAEQDFPELCGSGLV